MLAHRRVMLAQTQAATLSLTTVRLSKSSKTQG